MINTNTDKPTQKSTATISESSIYLKKSELPQNISSFKNDVGYISSSALGVWLKEHAYISKTEITSLINKANLVVVDTVNKSADSEAINRLNQEITGIKGEIVEIKDILENINNTYVSTERIKSLATKTDIANLSDEIYEISTSLSNIDLSNIATKDEIPILDGYAKEDWVKKQGYLKTHQSLVEYVKKSDLPTDYVKESDLYEYVKVSSISSTLNNYVKKSSLSEYVKTSTFNNKLSNFAQKLEGYAKQDWVQDWVNEQGFLTESQDLSKYATKTDLKDYVKIKLLNNTLNGYAKKNSVYTQNESDSKFLSKIDASDIYLTKTSADVQFASKQMVEREYLKIEDYRGLKDATVINDDYKDKSLEILKGDLNKLMNGFYIVNSDDIVVVKDHNVVNIFKDGAPQAIIEWKEE